MKKLLSLLLALCMVLSLGVVLASCGGDDDGSSKKDKNLSPISKEEWNEIIASDNFKNFTFKYTATFSDQHQYDEPATGVLALANGKLSYNGEIQSSQAAEAAQTWYIDSALAIVNNFDDFVYDEKNNCYTTDKTIRYNVNIHDYNAKIEATNVVVEFDSDKNIAKISCDMLQKYEENGQPAELSLKVVFEFYNYGTTVVE